ncbi:MAG TPA: hypothetical protein VH257_12900 [Chloroflexota bacterium]|nr:hypothetical protein [Chloroflexota bacterium]
MSGPEQLGLEQALGRLESDAEAALRAAGAVTTALKRVRAAAQAGDLRALRPALGAAERAVDVLAGATGSVKAAWDVDEEGFFAGGAYTRELVAAAAVAGLRLHEQDERLYAYPAIVQVVPGERAVLIDRRRERRLRPSVLARQLKALQERPARFRPQTFLEALYGAYQIAVEQAVARRGPQHVSPGAVVRLLDLYGLLTLLPGQSREYSRLEFARDVYLLEQSGETTTRGGQRASFPSSTGTRRSAGTLRVVARDGRERLYYGVTFRGPQAPAGPGGGPGGAGQ